VSVSHRHREGLISEQFCDSAKIGASHHQSARERVPQAVPSKVFDLGFFNCDLEPRACLVLSYPPWRFVDSASIGVRRRPIEISQNPNVLFWVILRWNSEQRTYRRRCANRRGNLRPNTEAV
jgi:hypothetical protein